jgi:hypothetical protein
MAVMRIVTAIFLFTLTLSLAQNANADDPAQAKEVARINNCSPKKVEVYQQTLGIDGKTIYHVDCNVPKGKSDTPTANALLISCDENLCELLRALPPDTK